MALLRDIVVVSPVPTVLTNMMVASGWLEALSGNRAILDSQGSIWRRHRFVYGCLFSADRRRVLACEGFPDTLCGWGYNDTLFAARLEATGAFLLPVLSAWGQHIKHDLRHPDQWFQYARNRLAYEQLLDSAADRQTWRRHETSRSLAEHATTSMPRHTHPEPSPREISCSPATLHALGFWSEFLDAFDHSTTVAMLSESLFWLKRYDEAVACAPTATLWAALSLHRLGHTAGAYRLLNAAADDDATAAYACQASWPELEYLRDHHLAAGLSEAAQLYQDVLEINGWRRPPHHATTQDLAGSRRSPRASAATALPVRGHTTGAADGRRRCPAPWTGTGTSPTIPPPTSAASEKSPIRTCGWPLPPTNACSSHRGSLVISKS